MSNQVPGNSPCGPDSDAKRRSTSDHQKTGKQNDGYQPDNLEHAADNERAPPPPPPRVESQQSNHHKQQNPVKVEASAPAGDTKSTSAACCTGSDKSIEVVMKLIKTVCFIVMVICASVGYARLKKHVTGGQADLLEVIQWGIAAGVIGLILEVITNIPRTFNVLIDMANPSPQALIMIFNIVSLILFFTSVIPLVHTVSGTEVAAFTAFAIFGLMAGAVELYTQICILIRVSKEEPE